VPTVGTKPGYGEIEPIRRFGYLLTISCPLLERLAAARALGNIEPWEETDAL
jgi:hypothetical protein